MENCEPIRIACPKCGTRYRIKSETVFNWKAIPCGKCKTPLRVPDNHLRPKPVNEDEILTWLGREDFE